MALGRRVDRLIMQAIEGATGTSVTGREEGTAWTCIGNPECNLRDLAGPAGALYYSKRT